MSTQAQVDGRKGTTRAEIAALLKRCDQAALAGASASGGANGSLGAGASGATP